MLIAERWILASLRNERFTSLAEANAVPCLVLAALLYQTPWLAATLILLSVRLPRMAVITANDRLPEKRTPFQGHHEATYATAPPLGRPALTDHHHRVIDLPDEP